MVENWEIHWKDYYKILQVDSSAEPEVIKAARDKLAFKYHPDRFKSPDADGRMKGINEAFEILGNIQKKGQYDLSYFQNKSSGDGFSKSEAVENEVDLADYFTQRNIKFKDKIPNGGSFWIIGGHELDSVIEELKEMGVAFHYAKNGGKASGQRPAWFYKKNA